MIDGADPRGHDPIADLVHRAATGRFPDPDGRVTVVGPDRTTGLSCILGFTGHAVIAAASDPRDRLDHPIDGFGSASGPDVQRAIAGPGGWIGVLDTVLVADAHDEGPGRLRVSDAFDDHPRVRYARSHRLDVEVLADERGLATLGTGLGGRTELGFELAPGDWPHGTGRGLVRDALGARPEGTPVFASCAPGNARSLRCLLALGFRAIGSEVLIRPEPI